LSENPHQNELRMIALELSTSLSPSELQALDKLRQGFGMVRAVRLVEDDVATAVKGCAEENPDLDEEITSRHEAWEKSVNPERKQAETRMESYIGGGIFSQPEKIRDYFEATDK